MKMLIEDEEGRMRLVDDPSVSGRDVAIGMLAVVAALVMLIVVLVWLSSLIYNPGKVGSGPLITPNLPAVLGDATRVKLPTEAGRREWLKMRRDGRMTPAAIDAQIYSEANQGKLWRFERGSAVLIEVC